jgi:ABC-type antimicrobial peptide transport system permease subunit
MESLARESAETDDEAGEYGVVAEPSWAPRRWASVTVSPSSCATDAVLDVSQPCWDVPDENGTDPDDVSLVPGDPCAWRYPPPIPSCPQCEAACLAVGRSAQLLLMDAVAESRMGLGSGWRTLTSNIGVGHAIVQSRVARSLDLAVNDTFFVNLPLGTDSDWTPMWNLMQAAASLNATAQEGSEAENVPGATVVAVPFVVDEIFSSAGGKFGDNTFSAILVDHQAFLRHLAAYADVRLEAAQIATLANIPLAEYAAEVALNLPPGDRLDAYISSDADTVVKRLTSFVTAYMWQLGFPHVSADMPISELIHISWALSMMLGLLLNIIASVLVLLSIALVYALLAVAVESRQFEFAVMRLLGAPRSLVAALMLSQSAGMSVPAIVLGLVGAQLGMVMVSIVFSLFAGVSVSSGLTTGSVLRGVALGLLVPACASVLPVRRALELNVRSGLDLASHSAPSPVVVSVDRSADHQTPWSTLLGAGMVVVFGFSIYYLFPLALLSTDIGLLLDIFVALLLGMLLGFIILSLNVAQPLQVLLIRVFFSPWETDAVTTLVRKNLISHKLRNRKTIIMFGLSVAFVTFLNVAYAMQENEFVYTRMSKTAQTLQVIATQSGEDRGGEEGSGDIGVLPFEAVAAVETIVGSMNDTVASYAWNTASLRDSCVILAGSSDACEGMAVKLVSRGGYAEDYVYVYGVSPQFFAVAFSEFLTMGPGVSSLDDLADALSVPGTAILGSAYQEKFGLTLGDVATVQIFNGLRQRVSSHPLRAVGFLDAAPSFRMSRFPGTRRQAVMVSLSTFAMIIDRSVEELPLENLLLRLHGEAGTVAGRNEPAVDQVKAQLTVALRPYSTQLKLHDVRPSLDSIKVISAITTGFFGFATVLSVLISSFSLASSMVVNIAEQRSEIGVLRAIGLSKSAIVRAYVAEAFVVVLSAVLLGTATGACVGYTVSAQQVLFTQLPLPFVFPTQLLLSFTAAAAILAFLTTVGPLFRMLAKTPTTILRGN